MKIDEENNKVYLNDIEMMEYETVKGFYEIGKAMIIGGIIGLIIAIFKTFNW